MFCVPAHGRLEKAAICLRQLRRSCDELAHHGVYASAVVVADDANLDVARALDFGTVQRNNVFLGRKFNDAFQIACDPAFNPEPADFVVPCGSDDWVDWRLFTNLSCDTVTVFSAASVVREDGREISLIRYPSSGVRAYPRRLLKTVGYRPADEDRKSGCDTSILLNVQAKHPGLRIDRVGSDARQIVDWKTVGEQLHAYRATRRAGSSLGDPLQVLQGVFPDAALDDMACLYDRQPMLVAA